MPKILNLPDLLIIAFSAYAMVWGMNYALRQANMAGYQA